MLKDNIVYFPCILILVFGMYIIPTTASPQQDPEFYQRIIDFNIFRFLGWKPAKSRFPYELLGTVTYPSGNKKPKAFIQTTSPQKKSYYVTLHHQLGNLTVVDIQAKKITFDREGEKIILHLRQRFLNPSRTFWKSTPELHPLTDKSPSHTNNATSLENFSKINWNGKVVYWDPSEFTREEIEERLHDGRIR